jgi:RNA polymerase sigma-70 factor (ECF subfamily)
MNISTLFNEARNGSMAAQKCLFDLWSDKMLLLCRRYTKNREDAEEIMLDGFYKFFKNLPNHQFKGPAAFAGWLKKIMINECLMFLRKKNLFSMIAESNAEEIPLEAAVLSNLSAAEIFQAITELPLGYRTVFNLYEIEGMSHAEIAGLLEISEGTSKSQLSKAKSLLQKKLTKNGTDYARQQSK